LENKKLPLLSCTRSVWIWGSSLHLLGRWSFQGGEAPAG